jgi:hypothetical protein
VRHINDPDGMRDAWALVEGLWASTVERACRLPESALHERVGEEWAHHQYAVRDLAVLEASTELA